MRYFTDSPYERMMQEVPRARREDEVPPMLPGNKPCKTCQYNRPVCIGVLCKNWEKSRLKRNGIIPLRTLVKKKRP